MSKLKVAASLLLLVVAQVIVAKPVKVGPSHLTMKVISMVENGPVVTLRLADGSTADVAKSTLHIRDEAGKRGTARTVEQLSHTTNLPAIVKIAYGPDGSIKKARLRVFTSEQSLNAFTAKRAAREQNR